MSTKVKTYPRLARLIVNRFYKPKGDFSKEDKLLTVNKHIAIYKGVHPGSEEFVYLSRWYKNILVQAFAQRHSN